MQSSAYGALTTVGVIEFRRHEDYPFTGSSKVKFLCILSPLYHSVIVMLLQVCNQPVDGFPTRAGFLLLKLTPCCTPRVKSTAMCCSVQDWRLASSCHCPCSNTAHGKVKFPSGKHNH